MAITTPALSQMDNVELLPEAYAIANNVLMHEGIDPLHTFVDSETQRHHYALALRFQHDFSRLETLAGIVSHDNMTGDVMLSRVSKVTDEEKLIALDFESHPSRHYLYRPSLVTYLSELALFGGKQ